MDLADRIRASPGDIAGIIDHTNVDPRSTVAEVDALCDAVRDRGFRSAVVLPYHVEHAHDRLAGTAAVVTVVGFPYGVQPTPAKVAEVEAADPYVDEVDMVMHRTAFANDDRGAVADDVAAVKAAVGDRPLKCIIETPALDPDEIRTAAGLVEAGGADVVKTAVGYDGPADPTEVSLIRETVGSDVGIKASGGIDDFETAMAMVEAGATRNGASAGEAIVDSRPGV